MSSERPEAGWYSDPGGSGQRYWNGTAWTAHHKPPQGGSPPPAVAPSGGGRFKTVWTNRLDSRRGWIITGVIAAVIAVAVVVMSNRSDPASYQAGHEDGTRFARTYTALSGDHLPDLNIKIDCGIKGAGARSDGVWWSGGRIEGKDLDRDAYEDGCFAAIRWCPSDPWDREIDTGGGPAPSGTDRRTPRHFFGCLETLVVRRPSPTAQRVTKSQVGRLESCRVSKLCNAMF
jgi:hypothetical protein